MATTYHDSQAEIRRKIDNELATYGLTPPTEADREMLMYRCTYPSIVGGILVGYRLELPDTRAGLARLAGVNPNA